MAFPNFSDLTTLDKAMIVVGAGAITYGAVDIYKTRRKRLDREQMSRIAAGIEAQRRRVLAVESAPKTIREPTPEERCLNKYKKQGMTERQAFFACYEERRPGGGYVFGAATQGPYPYASKKKTKKSVRSSQLRNAMNNAASKRKRKSKSKTRKSILDRILASAYHAASIPRRRRKAKRKLWIDRKVKRPGTFRRMLERAGIIERKERIPLWVKKMGCKTPTEAYRKIFHKKPTQKAARLFQRRACLARTFEDLPTSSGRHIIRVRTIGGRKVKVSLRGPGARKATSSKRNRSGSEPCYELWYGRPGHERREGRFTSMEQVDRRKKSLTALEKPLGIHGTRFQIVDCTGTRVLRERNSSRLTTRRRAA